MRALLFTMTITALAAPLAACHPARDAQAAEAAWSAPHAATALSDALGRTERHFIADVAVDAAGTLHAVFGVDANRDGRAEALRYARMDDTAWSAPRPVAASLSLADPAAVAVDGDGAVHVLWYTQPGAAAPRAMPSQLVRRVLRGGRWGEPRVLYHEPSPWGMGVRWLAAAADARGDVQVLYAPQGRGFGHLSLRGERVSEARYLDHDGNMMEFSASAPGAPLEMAYIGQRVSTARPRAANDVFVRALRGGEWGEAREAYFGPERYAHYPQLVVDGRGVRHLFWLEDTNGTVPPEAVYYATSRDGVTWSTPADVTPAGLRGAVPLRLRALPDASGRVHLLVRYATAGTPRVELAYFSVHEGRASPQRPLARAGEIGPTEAHLAYDARRGRVIALWRDAEGVYRWSALRAG